jgi:hypothetical protein
MCPILKHYGIWSALGPLQLTKFYLINFKPSILIIISLCTSLHAIRYLADYIFLTNGTTHTTLSRRIRHLRHPPPPPFFPFLFCRRGSLQLYVPEPPFTTSDNASFEDRSDVLHQYCIQIILP